ncbi:aspartyl/asparaginyl beta-hydroxylase domain-containing protein [Candidatus Babeliales bacterium]|nr:aspartyl/asparaginyl beta-hydroxylase domain-containing protein [Candidatus Babeliales bacterium]
MFNFKLIDVLDVSDLLEELELNKELFGKVPLRTSPIESPHREAKDILLRGPDIDTGSLVIDLWNEIQCTNYSVLDKFPLVLEHVLDVMRMLDGTQLGRIIITSLPPKGKIYEHIDAGDAGEFYTRYHTVLQSGEGNLFTSGDETIDMCTGDIFYINNHVQHSVHNDSNVQRIHLIYDIRL